MRAPLAIAIMLYGCVVWNRVSSVTGGACASDSTAALQMRIAAVKSAILSKLGAHFLPSNSTRAGLYANPDHLAAYGAASNSSSKRGTASKAKLCEGESTLAKTILLYVPISYTLSVPSSITYQKGMTTQSVLKLPESYRLKFRLSIPNHSLIAYAQLRLYKISFFDDVMIKTDAVGVEVYAIPALDNSARARQQALVPTLVSSRMVDTTADAIEPFDVTPAVQKYANSSTGLSQLLDLQVVIRTPVSLATGLSFPPPVKFSVDGAQKGGAGTPAQLVVALLERNRTISGGSDARQRRSTKVNSAYCASNPTEPNCCLRPLEINFKRDLGWNWIIQPKSYLANYCEGHCPSYWPTATPSTLYLMTYAQSNPTAAVRPCCGTSVLKPLTILGVDAKGSPFLVEIPDMSVSSCVCR